MHTFHAADFVIRTDGVCRLNPEMARQVAGMIGRSWARAATLDVYVGKSDGRST
jgi:hypothetical protein